MVCGFYEKYSFFRNNMRRETYRIIFSDVCCIKDKNLKLIFNAFLIESFSSSGYFHFIMTDTLLFSCAISAAFTS